MVGDLAIFVNDDSADVWIYPELRRHADLNSEVVSGVPRLLQCHGPTLGINRWDVMKQQGYAWWIERLRWQLRIATTSGSITSAALRSSGDRRERADRHERALGKHGPNDDLFVKVRACLGGCRSLPRISAISHPTFTPCGNACTPAWPCCNLVLVMWAPTSVSAARVHARHCGLHGNTRQRHAAGLVGTWRLRDRPQCRDLSRAGRGWDPLVIHLGAAPEFVASLSVVPLQDVLGLGSDARMNTPSLDGGNWRWRLQPGVLKPDVAEKLARLAQSTVALVKNPPPSLARTKRSPDRSCTRCSVATSTRLLVLPGRIH